VLTGGLGDDTFVFGVGASFTGTVASAATQAVFASGVDVITDFTVNSDQTDTITPSLTATGYQAQESGLEIYGLGFNASIVNGAVVVNQFSAAEVDAGVKSFYIQGTWNAVTKTFADVDGGADYLLFQASITTEQGLSFDANATTGITAIFNTAEGLVLDNANYISV
jgi:hypothetical protein